MADLVSIDFKFPNLLARLQTQVRRLQIAVASDIQTNRGLLFDAEGAYNGHDKWKDLSSGANLRKAKNGLQERQILRKTGALKNSLAPQGASGQAGPQGYVQFSGDISFPVVKVGTNLKYAAIHNFGGTIQHPGTENGFGRGIKIKPHSIKIPKRNFTDWNNRDKENMRKVLKNTLEEILNGR